VKILFTGASSFTGMWFARQLVRAGHEVTATFRRAPGDYLDDVRAQRVAAVLEACKGIFGCTFGGERFVQLVGDEPWDLLCHHAADVTNYREPGFDVLSAVANNSRNLPSVLELLKRSGRGRTRVLITGSVFENDEGAGSQGLPAFSPYGLSKGFTYQLFRYHAGLLGLDVGKFVIPNPFGPLEEARFTAYLIRSWLKNESAVVKTPMYVRDNIHVSLLARAYVSFAEELGASTGRLLRARPSGYTESQGAFALRVSREMRTRLSLPCEVVLLPQTEFEEPLIRINTDPPNALALGWDEATAWDDMASYYLKSPTTD